MAQSGFALFGTAIGYCAVAWSDAGISGLQLPEGTAADTLDRLRRRVSGVREGAPPAGVREAIRGVTALLAGARIDLSAVTLDYRDTNAFDRSVYEVTRMIRAGETLTYGEIAARLGDPGQARPVGQALGRNSWPIIIPCHRVTAAGGKMGGFSARGGVATKLRLLAIESAHAADSLPLFASRPATPSIGP